MDLRTTRQNDRKSLRSNGATLMETVCVLAILGLLASYASHSIPPSLVHGQQARIEAHTLADRVRRARSLAIRKHTRAVVSLGRVGNRIRFLDVRVGNNVHHHEFPFPVQVDSRVSQFSFGEDGTPSQPVTWIVRGNRDAYRIDLEAVTGFVLVRRADSR